MILVPYDKRSDVCNRYVSLYTHVHIYIQHVKYINICIITTASTGKKDELYEEPFTIIRRRQRSDVLVAAGDFNAQAGKLVASEACLGGRCTLPGQPKDNGERLLKFRADNRSFLSSSNFRHSSHRIATDSLSQIDHILISYR